MPSLTTTSIVGTKMGTTVSFSTWPAFSAQSMHWKTICAVTFAAGKRLWNEEEMREGRRRKGVMGQVRRKGWHREEKKSHAGWWGLGTPHSETTHVTHHSPLQSNLP